MVEDVGLNCFILIPHFVGKKEIDFYREPELTGLSLCDDEIEILSYDGMVLQIFFHIDSV